MEEPVGLKMYDANGYRVLEQSFQLGEVAVRIDVSGLRSGHYIVHILHNDHTEIQRLLIE